MTAHSEADLREFVEQWALLWRLRSISPRHELETMASRFLGDAVPKSRAISVLRVLSAILVPRDAFEMKAFLRSATIETLGFVEAVSRSSASVAVVVEVERRYRAGQLEEDWSTEKTETGNMRIRYRVAATTGGRDGDREVEGQ